MDDGDDGAMQWIMKLQESVPIIGQYDLTYPESIAELNFFVVLNSVSDILSSRR